MKEEAGKKGVRKGWARQRGQERRSVCVGVFVCRQEFLSL